MAKYVFDTHPILELVFGAKPRLHDWGNVKCCLVQNQLLAMKNKNFWLNIERLWFDESQTNDQGKNNPIRRLDQEWNHKSD